VAATKPFELIKCASLTARMGAHIRGQEIYYVFFWARGKFKKKKKSCSAKQVAVSGSLMAPVATYLAMIKYCDVKHNDITKHFTRPDGGGSRAAGKTHACLKYNRTVGKGARGKARVYFQPSKNKTVIGWRNKAANVSWGSQSTHVRGRFVDLANCHTTQPFTVCQ
jgi:hypothetical protein